ncbi:MAG: PQQ-binding-like beta-propeller repeat protein, partial [Kofleriaceae bacterium]
VVRVTPDGKRILTAGDGTGIQVWDAHTGEAVAELAPASRGFHALAISADGRRVFAGGTTAQIFELATKRCLATPAIPRNLVVAAAFAPDHSVIFGDDKIPRRYDARGVELAPLKGHAARVQAIAISRDGRRALTCGGDSRIQLHALDTPAPEVLATWQGYARSCGFSPDGSLGWWVGARQATVRGMTTGKVTFDERLDDIRAGALSLDGTRFAIVTGDGIAIYALPGKRQVGRIAFVADSLAFMPDGARLVVANRHATAVFDVAGERRVLPADAGHTGSIEGVAIAADRPHVLFSTGEDGLIVLWDLETGLPIERIGSVEHEGRAIAVTADGTQLVTASRRGAVAVWNVARLEATPVAVAGQASVALALASAHAGYLADSPRSVQIIELATAAVVARAPCSGANTQGGLAFAGDLLIASVGDRHVAAIDLAGVRRWTSTTDHTITAVCVAGDLVIVGTMGGTLEAWDLTTGMHRLRLRASGPEIHHACALDAQHVGIVQRSADFDSSTIAVWKVAQRACVATADLAAGVAARCITASRDGRRLYVGTNTSRILVFERA